VGSPGPLAAARALRGHREMPHSAGCGLRRRYRPSSGWEGLVAFASSRNASRIRGSQRGSEMQQLDFIFTLPVMDPTTRRTTKATIGTANTQAMGTPLTLLTASVGHQAEAGTLLAEAGRHISREATGTEVLFRT
jgi:hypothetical protein